MPSQYRYISHTYFIGLTNHEGDNMRKKRGFQRLTIILSVFALILSGCMNSKESEPAENKKKENEQVVLKVAWWGNDGRKERTLKVIDLFESKYPNIKIEPIEASNSDYWILLASKAADQDFPDVIQMDYKYIDGYIKRKLIMPLDDLVKAGKLNISDMIDSSVASATFYNHLYGISTGVNAQSMMYNPEIFDQTGVAVPQPSYTYEDLTATAKELKDKVNKDDFYPIGSAGLDFAYYLRQNGATLYNKDGNALGYEQDELLSKFFEMEKMLVDEGLMVPPDIINKISSDKDSLIANKLAAFHSITSNNVISYNKFSGVDMQLLPLPSMQGGKEANYVKPSMFFSISAYTKHAEASAQFIDFFFNNLDANDILLGERGVPASDKVSKHIQQKLEERDKVQYAYMEYVEKNSSPIDPPAPLISTNINILFNTVRNQMLDGQITPTEAAQQFRDGAKEIFAQNNE